jgi:hypothetical protein
VVWFRLSFTCVVLLALTLVVGFRVTGVKISPVSIVVFLLIDLTGVVLLALALVMAGLNLDFPTVVFLALALVVRLTSLDVSASEGRNKV